MCMLLPEHKYFLTLFLSSESKKKIRKSPKGDFKGNGLLHIVRGSSLCRDILKSNFLLMFLIKLYTIALRTLRDVTSIFCKDEIICQETVMHLDLPSGFPKSLK